MKVLQICSFFCGSKVHSNLYKELDALGVEQTVFACTINDAQEMPNKFAAEHTDFVYKNIMRPIDSVLYHRKISKSYRELLKSVNPSDYELSSAVTLFSDGAVAYRLYEDFKIPYIVTVRNTDINTFLTYAPHTWLTALKVLRNARKIVFISKALEEKFCNNLVIRHILPEIRNKFLLQPNGIDTYWVDNVRRVENAPSHDIIYVGKFNRNKNVIRLAKAVLSLKKVYPDIHLHLVGGDGECEKKILRMCKENSISLTCHGKIFDKAELLALYRKCTLFAMPSIFETFGLVYLEALSQNLPVVYTKGQGIDGMFDETVGVAVSPTSTEDIQQAIKQIFDHREHYSNAAVDFNRFQWRDIARHYEELYQAVLQNES